MSRPNLILLFWTVVLGLGATSAFGAYQAANGDDGAIREFATNLVWPGVLIFAGVAAVVWLGWKANLD